VRDPLTSLLRLRRTTVDAARQDLAACLAAEDAAARTVAELKAAVAREMEAASSLAADDADVEAFAAWLRQIRPRQAEAHAAHDRARANTTRSRAALASARAAERAAEMMLDKRVAEQRAEAERREQHTLDEVALRRHRPPQ
jgi:flagellar export protein FliJ